MKSLKTIGAHWYARPATLKECANQMSMFIQKLKDHNPSLFSEWYKLGASRKKALQQKVDINYNSILKLFSNQSSEEDYPEISYSLKIWNGAEKDEEVTSLSVSLGSSESMFFTNNCVIKLPYNGSQFDFYMEEKNQEELIKIIQNHWNPEWIMKDSKRI